MHDLTDSQEFDWKEWVSQRPDAADIVGPGIYRFAFVWLSSMDDNLKERRGDFMVSRIDGTDTRLHPQRRTNHQTGLKEAFPVRGSWAEQWCPETPAPRQHDALAASQGQPPPPETYLGISQAL